MASPQVSELEQESFEPNEFVERLAWRASSGGVGVANVDDQDFDAQILHDTLLHAIEDLRQMQEKQKKKCQLLEQVNGINGMPKKAYKARKSRTIHCT